MRGLNFMGRGVGSRIVLGWRSNLILGRFPERSLVQREILGELCFELGNAITEILLCGIEACVAIEDIEVAGILFFD